MKTNITKQYLMKSVWALIAAMAVIVILPLTASAHCDTMDGPTVADGIKAMKSNNINYALKWVQPEHDKELAEIFNLSMKVKGLSPEAKQLSEKYFLENLIRIHRAGEGAPYTGLKPAGTPIDEKVLAADESIAVGNLTPIVKLVEKDQLPELEERFEKVMALKNFDVNDVEAGREYIEAYVKFFKFAEGEEDEAHGSPAAEGVHEEEKEVSATNWIPWSLAGLFFITTVIHHVKLKRGNK